MKKSKRNKAQKRQQALQRRQQHVSTRRPLSQIPPENADQVAMTTTGEIMQLIRLHYEVEDFDKLRAALALYAVLITTPARGGGCGCIRRKPGPYRSKTDVLRNERGIRGIRLQRDSRTSCSTSAPLNVPRTPWSSLTRIFPGRSLVSPR